MIETFGILINFLIADVLNPVLFAFMVYAAGTRRPVVTSSAMLLGHTAAYFGAGIVIALGLEKITHYLANPSSIDYLIALIVGLLLLSVAFPTAKKPETRRPEDSGSMTPLAASDSMKTLSETCSRIRFHLFGKRSSRRSPRSAENCIESTMLGMPIAPGERGSISLPTFPSPLKN
jgi:hypothetical protein